MSDDEYTRLLVEAGDWARDGLALVEATSRSDFRGMLTILGNADLRVLALGLANIAEQCAIYGAIAGGRLSENSPMEELKAVRDEVFLKVREAHGRAGLG